MKKHPFFLGVFSFILHYYFRHLMIGLTYIQLVHFLNARM